MDKDFEKSNIFGLGNENSAWGACDRAGSPQAACLQSETV